MSIKSANAPADLSSAAPSFSCSESSVPRLYPSPVYNPWVLPTESDGVWQPEAAQPLPPSLRLPRSEPGLLPTPTVYPQAAQESVRNTHMDPREILLSHLPFSADAKVIYDLVTPFGPIETMEPRIQARSLRVTFRTAESARRAVATLNGSTLFNTRIFVSLPDLSDPVWAGFLLKTPKDKCQVDLLPLKGDCEGPLRRVHQLKVTHRARLEDVNKVTPFALGLLTAGDSGSGVAHFVDYFKRKNRAGFVQLKGFSLYLVTNGPLAAALSVRMTDDQLLAIIAVNH